MRTALYQRSLIMAHLMAGNRLTRLGASRRAIWVIGQAAQRRRWADFPHRRPGSPAPWSASRTACGTRTTALSVPSQRTGEPGQMGHYQRPLVLVPRMPLGIGVAGAGYDTKLHAPSAPSRRVMERRPGICSKTAPQTRGHSCSSSPLKKCVRCGGPRIRGQCVRREAVVWVNLRVSPGVLAAESSVPRAE